MKNRVGLSFLLCIFVFVTGCTTIYNPATGRQETYFINDATEVSMGKKIARDVESDTPTWKDPAMVAYVNDIGKKIVAVSDRNYLEYHFAIIDQEGINAFAVPGGFIFVNKGLLERTDRDQLAFVLAHEIGHVCARHSIKRLQASLGVQLLIGLAFGNTSNTALKDAVDVIYNVVSLGYSRQDELLADSLAVRYVYKAGFDPYAGVRLMNLLEKESQNDYTLLFLRSHPPATDRIRNIREKIAALE